MPKSFAIFGAIIATVLILGGCASPAENTPGTTSEPSSAATQPPTPTPDSTPEPSAPTPVTQDETCDWDSPRLASGGADAPASAGSDLSTALIGSWQHTHIDSGSGFEALGDTRDIRYVFPSTTKLLYCQDVKGATSKAEQSAAIELDGANIVLPAPSKGFTVTAWTDSTMLWTNNLDGSMYLLKRR